MKFKAIFCACSLVLLVGLSVHFAISSTSASAPVQAKVDYSKGYPPKAAGASHLDLPNPIPLGDPATSDQWGLDDKWGISNLTHQNHTEKHKISCFTCHHTNGKENAALTEDVERCVNCHKAEGDEKNPSNADGEELNVKAAFHLGVAGCISCHEAEMKKNPNSTAVTSCAGCHAAK